MAPPVLTDEIPPPYDLGPLITSWLRALRSENKSDNTIRIYGHAARKFREFLLTYTPPVDEEGATGRPAPTDIDEIHREHVQAYITELMARTSPANAHQHFRSLKTLFNWLIAEEELEGRHPMRSMKPPALPQKEVPVIQDAALTRLFKACRGKTFEDRRDTAILLLFLDTGVRLSELADRRVHELDLDLNVLHVLGKADKYRSVPFGKTTATALDRYLRAAAKHKGKPLSDESWLWWNARNSGQRITVWGVGTMLKRRCEEAGIEALHPHQFRHTFAHLWKLNGGGDDDLMRITGWSSREMLNRYGASAGAQRARTAHTRLSPADRLHE